MASRITSLLGVATLVACGDAGESVARAVTPVAGVDLTCTLVADAPTADPVTGDLGRLYCWGDGEPRARPRPDVSPELLRQLAVGNPSCAVQARSDRLVCWGANESGQVGDGTRETRLRATRVADVGVPLRHPRVSRFGEVGFACATGDDGVLRCWGAGARGQLGDGTRRDRLTPGPVRAFEAEGEAPRALRGETVALGAAHACALLDADAGVVCWGANESGQLGDGTSTDREVPTRVRLPGVGPEGELLPLGPGVRPLTAHALGLGRAHSCVLVTVPSEEAPQPAVLCWGANDRGQLGSGGPGPPERTPRRLDGLADLGGVAGTLESSFSQVAAGRDHSCLVAAPTGAPNPLTVGHELWCWGASSEQQTGLALGAAPPLGALRVTLPEGFGVEPFAVPGLGDAHGCVTLVATGEAGELEPFGARRVGCFGANDRGQLGDGSTFGARRPQRVLGLPAEPLEP